MINKICDRCNQRFKDEDFSMVRLCAKCQKDYGYKDSLYKIKLHRKHMLRDEKIIQEAIGSLISID